MTPSRGGQFLVYQTQDGKLKIDVRFEGETVWLTFRTSFLSGSWPRIQLSRNP